MANPDDDPRAARAALRREEDALAAFFDAARAEPRTPPAALLEAILADARRTAAGAGAPAASPAPAGAGPDLGALLRPLGGWGAATALAGCLALGLVAGSLGAGEDLAAETLWSDPVAALSADGIDGFFDLGATEG